MMRVFRLFCILILEDIEYVCVGTVIQEARTTNIAREVFGFFYPALFICFFLFCSIIVK